MTIMEQAYRDWRWRTGLIVVLAVAAWLRVTGLAFGLPAVYNPDEVAIMSRALAFAKGDLNPHNFLYPTFYFYVLFSWVGAWFVASWIAGAVPSLAAFQTQFFVDPTGVYLAGRALGVVCGVATVALVFVLGRRLFSSRAGLAAALFLAVAPAHVRDSHYVKHDVPVTLAVVAATLAIVSLSGLRSGVGAQRTGAAARRRLLLAGALCGVAFSTHYYTVFLVLPLVVAVWTATREGGLRAVVRGGIVAGAAATAVFFGLSPFLLAEPMTAWNDIVANRQIVVDRAVESGGRLFASAPAYLRMLWTEAVGWPVALAALAGLAHMARAQPVAALLLAGFPAAFLAFISHTVAASRYLNPVLPFVALFAGYLIWILSPGEHRENTGRTPGGLPENTGRTPGELPVFSRRRADDRVAGWRTAFRSRPGFARALLVLLSIALAWPGFSLSRALGRFFQQTDTRTLAQRAFERHAAAGSTVLIQPYSIPLVQSKESLEEALQAHLGDVQRASRKFALRLALDPYPAPAYRTLYLGDGGLDVDKIYLSYHAFGGTAGLETLSKHGVRYVVLKRYNTEDLAVVPIRTLLKAQGSRMIVVSPYRSDAAPAARAAVAPFLHNTDTPYHPALERPGPGIEVWELPETVWRGPSREPAVTLEHD